MLINQIYIVLVVYDRPLAEHMCSETGGEFRRLLTLIVTGVRDPTTAVDADRAKEQAEALYNAGEGKLGTDEEVFNKILAHENFQQLRRVFEEYKEVSGNTIEQALKHELDGELLEAMLAIGTPFFVAIVSRSGPHSKKSNSVLI